MNKLDELPNELVQMIYSFLTINQRLMLGLSCVRLYNALRKNKLFEACSKKLKRHKGEINKIIPNILGKLFLFEEFENIYGAQINYDMALMHASKMGNLEFIKWITLTHKYALDVINKTFELACFHQKTHIVRWFIETRTIVASCDIFPLICASGDFELVQQVFTETAPNMYIRKKANELACEYGHIEIVSWSLTHDLNNTYLLEHYFETACKNGNLDIAKIIYNLLKTPVHPRVFKNVYKNTLRNGYLLVAQWLDTLNNNYELSGRSELHIKAILFDAFKSKNVDLIKYVYSMIQKQGIESCIKSLHGLAIKNGDIDVLDCLMSLENNTTK